MESRWFLPPSSFLPVTFAALRSCSAGRLSAAGCASHGTLSGFCPFMPSNSLKSFGVIVSEPIPVGSLTGALRRYLGQESQRGDQPSHVGPHDAKMLHGSIFTGTGSERRTAKGTDRHCAGAAAPAHWRRRSAPPGVARPPVSPAPAQKRRSLPGSSPAGWYRC